MFFYDFISLSNRCEPHVCGIAAWFTPRFFVCMLHRELNGGGLDAFSESDEERID